LTNLTDSIVSAILTRPKCLGTCCPDNCRQRWAWPWRSRPR